MEKTEVFMFFNAFKQFISLETVHCEEREIYA